MHKKENMLLLVIPSQSFLHSHQMQNRNLKKDKQAPPQKRKKERKTGKNDQQEAQRRDRNS